MCHFYNDKNIIYISLFLIKICLSNNDIYRIPFGLINKNGSNTSLNIIHNIFYKEIYVNLSIGTPPQIIPFSLNINSQTFSVPNNIFHKNKSSSYESISKSEIPYENEDVIYGFISKDVLNINNKTKNKKIDFILGTNIKIKTIFSEQLVY